MERAEAAKRNRPLAGRSLTVGGRLLMDANNTRDILTFHQFLLGKTSVRLDRFQQAITKRVKPVDAVLDLGTGTGILAFFACLAGAGQTCKEGKDPGAGPEIEDRINRLHTFCDRLLKPVEADARFAEQELMKGQDVARIIGIHQQAPSDRQRPARERSVPLRGFGPLHSSAATETRAVHGTSPRTPSSVSSLPRMSPD